MRCAVRLTCLALVGLIPFVFQRLAVFDSTKVLEPPSFDSFPPIFHPEKSPIDAMRQFCSHDRLHKECDGAFCPPQQSTSPTMTFNVLTCFRGDIVYIDNVTKTLPSHCWRNSVEEFRQSVCPIPLDEFDANFDSTVVDESEILGSRRSTFNFDESDPNLSLNATLVFHPATAILLGPLCNSNHLFHLVADGMEQAIAWMEAYRGGRTDMALDHPPGVLRIPRRAVLTTSGSPGFLASNAEIGAAVSSNWLPALAMDSVDKRTHCFCGATVFARRTLSDAERSSALLSLKRRLSRMYGTPPYGSAVPAKALTPYWGAERNASRRNAPLFVYVKRGTREVRRRSEVLALAAAVGFRVLAVRLEHLPLKSQHEIGRYADVIAGMHGQGLLHAFEMDGTAGGRCRTLIEFFVWSSPEIYLLNCYQRLANVSNISYARLLPTNVSFLLNLSLGDYTYTRDTLMRNTSYVWHNAGFHHQETDYDLGEVERVLKVAFAEVTRCVAR